MDPHTIAKGLIAAAIATPGAHVHAQSINPLLDIARSVTRGHVPGAETTRPLGRIPLDPRGTASQPVASADCERIGQWLQSIPFAPGAGRTGQPAASSETDVLAAIDDERFAPAFGKRYRDMTDAELRAYTQGLGRCFTSAGPLARLDPRAKGTAMSALNPLLYRRNVALLDRMRAEQDRLGALAQELAGLKTSAGGYDRLLAIASQEAPSLAKLPADQRAAFQQNLAAAEERVAIPVEQQRVDAALAASAGANRLAPLVTLSDQLSGSSMSPAVMQARATQRARLAPAIASAAASALAEERSRIDALGPGLGGLERGVAWSVDFRRRFEALAPKLPEIRTVAAYFMERRRLLLAESRRAFRHELDAAGTPTALDAVGNRYLMPADKAVPEGAELWDAVAQRGADLRKWAILRSDPERDRRAPKTDPGEPTEGEMYDAYMASLDAATGTFRDMKEGCNNLKGGTSADALICVLGATVSAAGGDRPMAITTFEKTGCARANGQYGYVCDFVAGMSGGMFNSAVMGKTMGNMLARGGRGTARFFKDRSGWSMQPLPEK